MPGILVGALEFSGGKRFEVSIYDLLFENTDVITTGDLDAKVGCEPTGPQLAHVPVEALDLCRQHL